MRGLNTTPGEKYGCNTIISRISPVGQLNPRFLARCDCGYERVISSNSRDRKSCEKCSPRNGAARIAIGQRFGSRVVLRQVEKHELHGSMRTGYLIQCDCGTQSVLASSTLDSTKGCRNCRPNGGWSRYGDLSKIHSDIHKAWGRMKRRCYAFGDPKYAAWAGRGITVCDEWKNSFPTFTAWCLANGFRKGLSLDRINEDGPYSPVNCQWITRSANSRKARSVYRATFRASPAIECWWGAA